MCLQTARICSSVACEFMTTSMEGSPGAAREPRVYGKPAGCSKWMRSYSRLGALVSKESARQYEEGQTDARSDECLPEVNSCKGLFQRAPRLADRVNSPAETASRLPPGNRSGCLPSPKPRSHLYRAWQLEWVSGIFERC